MSDTVVVVRSPLTDDYRARYVDTLGSPTAQQLIRKNTSAWKSFFELNEQWHNGEREERPSPPGYWGNEDDGRELFADFRETTEEIARLQSQLEDGRYSSRRIRRLYRERTRRRDHAQEALARDLMERLYEEGVATVYVGEHTDQSTGDGKLASVATP